MFGLGAASKSWSTGSLRRCSRRRSRRRNRRRRHRAWPRASTRRGGSGRRGTWTGRWRSSPAPTRRRLSLIRLGGLYAEWTDLVKRRFGDRGALVYSQGTGQAAALVPSRKRRSGGRGGPGDAVAARQGRLGAQPPEGSEPLAKACPRP